MRTDHAHVIVEAEVPPEKVMNDSKDLRKPSFNRHDGRIRSDAMGTSWRHAMAVEGPGCS